MLYNKSETTPAVKMTEPEIESPVPVNARPQHTRDELNRQTELEIESRA